MKTLCVLAFSLAPFFATACGVGYDYFLSVEIGRPRYYDPAHDWQNNLYDLIAALGPKQQIPAGATRLNRACWYESALNQALSRTTARVRIQFDNGDFPDCQSPQSSACQESHGQVGPTALMPPATIVLRLPERFWWADANIVDRMVAFLEGILPGDLTSPEIELLVRARHALAKAMHMYPSKPAWQAMSEYIPDSVSPALSEPVEYLRGAGAFYDRNLDEARKIFTDLGNRGHGWIGETATYMVGRVELHAAQTQWDGYSTAEEFVDSTLLDAAQQAFDHYLAVYPQGRYRSSIAAMARRFALLRGDGKLLSKLELDNVNQSWRAYAKSRDLGDWAKFSQAYQEWSLFYRYWRRSNAIEVDLLADALPLVVHRVISEPRRAAESAKTLERRSDANDDQKVLLLLRLTALYRAGEYQSVMAYYGRYRVDEPVDLGINAALARAAFKLGQFDQARAIWLRIQGAASAAKNPLAIQQDIAATWVQQSDLLGLSRRDSGVVDERIFADVFARLCEATQLETIASDPAFGKGARRAATAELMLRALVHRQFDRMARLFEDVLDPGKFLEIEDEVLSLAANPDQAEPWMRIGHFLLGQMIRPRVLSRRTDLMVPGTPASCPDRYRDGPFAGPQYFLAKGLLLFPSGQRSEIEARTLHQLVLCYRSGVHARHCLWGWRHAKAKPHSLFRRLHQKYPDSTWAKDTPYWYGEWPGPWAASQVDTATGQPLRQVDFTIPE